MPIARRLGGVPVQRHIRPGTRLQMVDIIYESTKDQEAFFCRPWDGFMAIIAFSFCSFFFFRLRFSPVKPGWSRTRCCHKGLGKKTTSRGHPQASTSSGRVGVPLAVKGNFLTALANRNLPLHLLSFFPYSTLSIVPTAILSPVCKYGESDGRNGGR